MNDALHCMYRLFPQFSAIRFMVPPLTEMREAACRGGLAVQYIGQD